MATEFSREFFADNRIVKAELRSARKPREEELNRIRAEVRKLYDATEVILNVTVDESLLSGYVLQVGDRVFDNSGRHQLDKMMEGKPSLATLKTRIEDYKPAETSAEGGVVISSADGIVHVEGMNRAVYGEIVTFDNGAKGMVESVDPEQLGIMLFDGAETVGVGTMVTRSGKRAGIPVGDAFLGRVISPLGEPTGKRGTKNADTSWNHYADRSDRSVCTGRCVDLQAGRLEGRGLRRQLCILPQPLRKTGPEQKSLSSKMPPDIACWQRPGAFCFQLSVSR